MEKDLEQAAKANPGILVSLLVAGLIPTTGECYEQIIC